MNRSWSLGEAAGVAEGHREQEKPGAPERWRAGDPRGELLMHMGSVLGMSHPLPES